MRDVRLRRSVRFAFVAVSALSLVFLGVIPGRAASAMECRDLATRYAAAPAELDLRSLAGLLTCVTADIQDRAGGAEPPPPPASPAGAAPAPAAAPAPPPPSPPAPPRARDEWPPPIPWGGDWPPPSPWER